MVFTMRLAFHSTRRKRFQQACWTLVPVALAGLALATIAGLAVWTLRPRPLFPLLRVAVSVPPRAPVAVNGPFPEVAISADRTMVVYRGDGTLQVRTLAELAATPRAWRDRSPESVLVSRRCMTRAEKYRMFVKRARTDI